MCRNQPRSTVVKERTAQRILEAVQRPQRLLTAMYRDNAAAFALGKPENCKDKKRKAMTQRMGTPKLMTARVK